MSIFLLPDDVKKLTGYERASFQLAWCKDNGVVAFLSAAGEVNIPIASIEGRRTANDEAWAPDFSPIQQKG